MHARVTHTISQAGSWGGRWGLWHLTPDRITNDEVKSRSLGDRKAVFIANKITILFEIPRK